MNEYESPEETSESAAEQDMEESFAFNSGSTDGTSLDKEEGVNESQDFLFEGLRFFGSFKGFAEQGLDFAADLAAPYDAEFQDVPQMGQFLLIELGHFEAALGRITHFHPAGMLASHSGEEYLNTIHSRGNEIPEELKAQQLRYHVQIKLLGAVRKSADKLLYIPSQRRVPQLGAKVFMPSGQVLRQLCKLSEGDTHLGSYALGEFVYCGENGDPGSPVLRPMNPQVDVSFNIKNLVSRRSVVFARAGYGKSNLMKLLVSELYRSQPYTESEQPRPVGMLVFDPEGEYFWPDQARGRPGLCDVPQLENKISIFTKRNAPNAHYARWKSGGLKIDIRMLKAREVVEVALPEDKQDQQNVMKIKGMSQEKWGKAVDVVYENGLAAGPSLAPLLGNPKPIELGAAVSNLNRIVKALHDPDSRILNDAISDLAAGKVVIVDISLIGASAGNHLCGLLLHEIFSHNQLNFTGGKPIIPVVAVLEEAQSFLDKKLSDKSPFVEWVKEGRKYELGAILVTQQPGALAPELLSQADNWFCFHLLSSGDAQVLGKYNNHFSKDVLSHIIGEPIPGNCYFWSAPHQPFVLPVRIKNFEDQYEVASEI